MTRAPAGWGIAGEIESALDTQRARGARQVAESRGRAARIAYWLGGCREIPSPEEIIDRWGVSRATAYRWHAFAKSGGTEFPSS